MKYMEKLSVNNLSFHYKKRQVLQDVSFSVSTGEIVGLMGLNGSGKSTVLKCILGLLRPDNGTIMINGEERNTTHRKLIGYCPQENSFLGKLTVEENIHYFGYLYDMSKYEVNIISDKVSSLMGFEGVMKEQAENLSGGYKRRLNIACGIVHEPKFLLLDEPSLALDPIARKTLWKTIDQLSSTTAIIVSSNIMEELDILCDRIIMIKDGRSIEYRGRSS